MYSCPFAEIVMTKEEMICRIIGYVTKKPSTKKTCCR
jgi:hypothetical protein